MFGEKIIARKRMYFRCSRQFTINRGRRVDTNGRTAGERETGGMPYADF